MPKSIFLCVRPWTIPPMKLFILMAGVTACLEATAPANAGDIFMDIDKSIEKDAHDAGKSIEKGLRDTEKSIHMEPLPGAPDTPLAVPLPGGPDTPLSGPIWRK